MLHGTFIVMIYTKTIIMQIGSRISCFDRCCCICFLIWYRTTDVPLYEKNSCEALENTYTDFKRYLGVRNPANTSKTKNCTE